MFPVLTILLAVAGAVSAPALSQNTVQTIRVQNDGTTKVDSRSVDATATTVQFTGPDGRTAEATWLPQRRVLIEIRERPVLDRMAPGSAAEATRQRARLARDLSAIDARRKPRTPSRITREYRTLFSGVAATVDAAVMDEIRKLPDVTAVHEDFEVRANLTDSVPMIGATAVASTYGVTGAGVTVAVIDTGIDYTHPDLGGCLGAACRVAGGYDFVNLDDDPRDDYGHGTHVAGIIAANGTLKGVAPGATLLAYKVLNEYGYGYNSDIIAALEKAVLDGAKVANLSLGGSGSPSDPTSQALDNATAAGMLSVVAAGNSGYSYQSIQSPGVARTALTVGATDKSWQMASFSSRGYVLDGDQYVMKPEVVAPGVNIRSTVPTTGPLGDPSGYASLSGTSMATPHVAGSAALLLQWNAAQTPAEIKQRLAASARTIDADLFKRGTGGIDLVAAFAARILPSSTHVSFGVVDATSGIITSEQTLSLRNTAATADTVSLSAASSLPAGATLQIIPPTVTLQPGASAGVTLRLQVDAAVVPEAPDPLAWTTTIAMTGGTQAVSAPAYFMRGSVLTMTFDEEPWYVQMLSESGSYRTFSGTGTSFTTLVHSGLWDVAAFYQPPLAIVTQEQLNVQHSMPLHFERAQATLEATVQAIDEAQQPLREWAFMRTLVLDQPGLSSSIMSPDNFRLSPLSSRFLVALSGSGPDPTGARYFTSRWAGKGFTTGVVLPKSGVPFRRLAVSAAQPSGEPPAALMLHAGFAYKTTWGGIAFSSGTGQTGELSRTWYTQTTLSPDSPMLPIQRSTLTGFSSTYLEGAYLNGRTNGELVVDQSPFFNLLDLSHEPDTVLGANIERWDLDVAPHALPLDFRNSPSAISARGADWPTYWLTHTISTIVTLGSAAPAFDLVRNGVPAGTYPLWNLGLGITSEAGPHELQASSAYIIGGVPGSTQAVISFDTTRTDPNPPYVSRFRIEQGGLRTPAPYYPAAHATPIVRFRVTDNVSVGTVTLERRTNGTASWTSVPLTKTGSDYQALLAGEGATDLRLTATDPAGNTFREEWTPAVITTAAVPPSPPAFLTATRAATSAISLSWAAGSSPLGIAGYRIERMPGNTVITSSGTGTTLVDTNGLVPGNAYCYRVSAVDTNDAVSTPTAYDLATLIMLNDDPAVPGVTRISGFHITDLKRAIDAVRQAAGLPSAWSSYDPLTGVVRASHFVDLRDRLNEARSILQLPAVQFVNGVSTGKPIRANDLLQLRNGIK
jgi:subtilisin family serine protease